MRLVVGLSISVIGLVGCGDAPGLNPSQGDVFGPKGSVSQLDAIDGLDVGHALMAAGRFEEAYTAYLRAAAVQGTTVDILSALGSANLFLGRLGQAEKLLRQAIQKDQRFVPAWNNLGVVLMERDKIGEATRVFQTAFALDSGNSDEIRENLRRAQEKLENSGNPAYSDSQNNEAFDLVRRGNGRYLLLQSK